MKSKLMIYFENDQDKMQISYKLKRLVRLSVEATLAYEEIDRDLEVSVTFIDNEGIRKLNRSYRKIDKATDVLSFPLFDFEGDGDAMEDELCDMLGDLLRNLLGQLLSQLLHDMLGQLLGGLGRGGLTDGGLPRVHQERLLGQGLPSHGLPHDGGLLLGGVNGGAAGGLALGEGFSVS